MLIGLELVGGKAQDIRPRRKTAHQNITSGSKRGETEGSMVSAVPLDCLLHLGFNIL